MTSNTSNSTPTLDSRPDGSGSGLIALGDIITRTGGVVSGTGQDTQLSKKTITHITIDSRDCAAGSLFVALPGATADGHDFVNAAAKAGATAALVTCEIDIDGQSNCAQIIVEDTLQAVSDLAVMARLEHQMAGGYLVGITGSVGKTGSKEMLAHILRRMTGCYANKSSYNNHIGVPLTIASLSKDTPVAVQEMGMNAAGEIADLTLIAAPDVALITRIADSHSGFFDSLAAIASAKAEIFDGLVDGGVAVLNRDDEFYDDLVRRARLAGAGRIISFGQHDDAEFRLIAATSLGDGSGVTNGLGVDADIAGTPLRFRLAMNAPHWAMNAVGILAVIDALGLDVGDAAAHLADFTDLPGRGAIFKTVFGGKSITLIDDSYNAGPASMTAGLGAILSTAKQRADILVLSDMLELGAGTAAAHTALVPLINDVAPRHLIAIGPAMHEMAGALDAGIDCKLAASPDAAIAQLEMLARDGDRIFIKGSLGSGSWRVAKAIMAATAIPGPSNGPSDGPDVGPDDSSHNEETPNAA